MARRLLRSCLFTPGINAKALEKSFSLPADVLILDLEDSVAPASKKEARALVLSKISEKHEGIRRNTQSVIVRINDPLARRKEERSLS